MARDTTAAHRKASARHEHAAATHDQAATFWERQGDSRRAALQREMAEYELEGAKLERRWANLTDTESPQRTIGAGDEVRQMMRERGKQAVANLMQLADTLARSAGLADEHARRSERAGKSDEAAVEQAAADRAREAARRAREQAEEWAKLLSEGT